LEWLDRKGATQPANAPPQNYSGLRLSPDGERVAVQIQGADSTGSDIWICDLARGSLARLTFDGLNSAPIWTPDGRRITFAHQEKADVGIYWVAADGSGKPGQLMGAVGIPTSWSPDGKTLLYDHVGTDNKPSIWMLPAPLSGVDGKPHPFLEAAYEQQSAQISPDGRWMVYVSNESGSPEVYVQPFPIQGGVHGGKTPISTHGGFEPRWSRTGQEIFFRTTSAIVTVSVQATQTFRAIQSQVLFPYSNSYGYSWDVAPERKGFLAIKYANSPGGRLQAVVNWFEELRPSGTRARK
jgi:Tol biopolymer transport system component